MNFYKQAAEMLDKIESKRSSIKGCLSLAPAKDRKRLGALIIETLKLKPSIMSIMKSTPLMQDERRHLFSPNFAALLVHDMLFNSGGIQAANGPIKQAVYRHKTRLQAELVRLKMRNGVRSNADLAQPEDPRIATMPRYLRVNRNLWTADDAKRFYLSKKYSIGVASVIPAENEFRLDEHIPDLFLFHPSHKIHADEAYNSGKMIAQDKASCFPALVLDPPPLENVCVIDATAAPGNKTSHLSALMKNRGKIFAFERNRKRFKTLEETLARTHCKNVEPVLGDFLAQDPLDHRFKDVTHILLDPSCSGSGIVNRLDYLTRENDTEGDPSPRLVALSSFQQSMILHAVKFPAVIRIVYSTCSINMEENEAVVQAALESSEMLIRGFELAPRSQVLPSWNRRGIAHGNLDASLVEGLVRCSPGEDKPGTNGFFVSSFFRDLSSPRKKRSLKRPRTTDVEVDQNAKPQKKHHV